MRSGYVYLQTHREHPGLVRLLSSEHPPATGTSDEETQVRYVAHFLDMDAGKMHAHEVLRRTLLDINTNLYKAPLPDAMAAIEADGLTHRREWLDPALEDAALERVGTLASKLRKRHHLMDVFWRVVGVIGIILLILHTTVL